jgi:hypothetical protein
MQKIKDIIPKEVVAGITGYYVMAIILALVTL